MVDLSTRYRIIMIFLMAINVKFMVVVTLYILISTVPLDLFLKMINNFGDTSNKVKTLADQFVYSHTHIIGIGLRGQPPKSLADKSWMYFPDADAPFYRITVFSSYSDDLCKGSYFDFGSV